MATVEKHQIPGERWIRRLMEPMTAHATVGVNNDLAAGQSTVAYWADPDSGLGGVEIGDDPQGRLAQMNQRSSQMNPAVAGPLADHGRLSALNGSEARRLEDLLFRVAPVWVMRAPRPEALYDVAGILGMSNGGNLVGG